MKPIKYKPLHVIAWGTAYTLSYDFLMKHFVAPMISNLGDHTLRINSRFGHNNFLLMELGGLFVAYYWVQGLEKVRPPRLKNFPQTCITAFQALFTNPRKNPEKHRDLNLRFAEVTQSEPYELDLIKANYFIRKGDLETAIEYYQSVLEFDKPIHENIILRLSRNAARPLLHAMYSTKELGDLMALTHEAYKTGRREEHKRLWKQILERYPSQETKILHAMFLTSANDPEAIPAWQRIITKNQLAPYGQSRNLVFEMPSHKNVLIVKQGPNLRIEYDILRQIYLQLPPEERISVVPLAIYGNETQTLITLRRNSPNLDSILSSKTEEERLALARKSLRTLQKFHTLNIQHIPEYDPINELRRRLTNRIPFQAKDPTRLLSAYEKFLSKFKLRKLPIHGDAYPTNFLEDGRILDPEKAFIGDPSKDFESFTTHPILYPFQERLFAELQIDPSNRNFFAIDIPLCQTGSFLNKDPRTSLYFYQLALDRLQALGERELYTATKDFIEPVIASLSSARH